MEKIFMNINTGSILNNKYIVIKELGKGAMGNVYLVESTLTKELFAVKRMDINPESGLSEEKAKEIFFKEVEFISRFNHPGLPESHGSFMEKGSFFLTMEYIKGKTLEDIINKNSSFITGDKAIKWAVELAEILDYLHNTFEAPIVYRDLKPANIIITPRGKARLIDFGISRYYNPDKNTDTFRLGSPGYAAPEQYKNMGQSSPQTDVFSLGVILFQLLTGYDPTITPFKFPPMKSLNQGISDRLEKIVRRAVELKPLKRYISAAEFKDTLLKYMKADRNEISPAGYSRHLPPKTKSSKKSPGKSPAAPPSVYNTLFELVIGGIVIVILILPFAAIFPALCPFIILAGIVAVMALPVMSPELSAKLNLMLHGPAYLKSGGPSINTPLHQAVKKENRKLIELLISYGANLEAKNLAGEAPLHIAVAGGDIKTAELLISEGTDIDLKESFEGNSSLHIAVERGFQNMVSSLVNRGAFIDTQNDSGETPLHIAANLGQEEIAKYLLYNGAKANMQNKKGNTPLHTAAYYNDREITVLLLKKGADKTICNNTGETPLQVALSRNNSAIKRILTSS